MDNAQYKHSETNLFVCTFLFLKARTTSSTLFTILIKEEYTTPESTVFDKYSKKVETISCLLIA